jgi:hypothetical protein
MTVAFASFSGFHGNVTLHCHWKYSLLALLQPCSGGVSLQTFAQNRLNCEYVTLSRQTSSTRTAKHRSFIKLKFLKNFCSSCKTLADQVARRPSCSQSKVPLYFKIGRPSGHRMLYQHSIHYQMYKFVIDSYHRVFCKIFSSQLTCPV